MKSAVKIGFVFLSIVMSIVLFVTTRPKPSEIESGGISSGDNGIKNETLVLKAPEFTFVFKETVSWKERVAEFKNWISNNDLSERSATELYALLKHQPSPSDEESWFVVFNEIATELRQHSTAKAAFLEEMKHILNNSGLHPVIHDYSIQHSALWFKENSSQANNSDEMVIQGIDLFADVAQTHLLKENTISGTVFNALSDLTDSFSEEQNAYLRKQLGPSLVQTIRSGDSLFTPTRIPAIQLAAKLGINDLRPDIYSLASSSDTNPSIRISSIAALGIYTNTKDRELLEDLSINGGYCRLAAETALQNFNHITE